MTAAESMRRIEVPSSPVWMVRTFLKHSDEAAEDEELRQVHSGLYDFLLALGGPLSEGDAETFVKQAKKKYGKLKKTTELFREIQPDVSTHTNFRMAAASLTAAVEEIGQVLQRAKDAPSVEEP